MTDFDFTQDSIPVLPLRDVVAFPHTISPLFVGRESSIKALQAAMDTHKHVLLLTQKESSIQDPAQEDLYEVGTIAHILQMLRLPDGTVKILVEGQQRCVVEELVLDEYLKATCANFAHQDAIEAEVSEKIDNVKQTFVDFAKANSKVSKDVLNSVKSSESNQQLVDIISANIALSIQNKQELLSCDSILKRADLLLGYMLAEMEKAQLDKKLNLEVKKRMDKTQRDYFLNEKIRVIRKELGHDDDAPEDELDVLKKRIAKANMPEAVQTKAQQELKKLKMMPMQSQEASVVRNYIDTLLDVPWSEVSELSNDLPQAQQILDEAHYGLEKVKDRILEYLAVQKRVGKIKGSILCLVGPPGVGKTSLAQSIAKSTQREYVRMALGGVRDEAEIRGHRRTYLGAMPGKIIQNMIKSGVRNPLFLLDEIDKMSTDHRGDPASALLEVLDPEQNQSFNDHYMEVDYDLSDVMFIATSNSMDIPAPLLDRMEVIRIAGYTEYEKLAIAQQYLLPNAIKDNGLDESELSVTDDALKAIIRVYTKEAGVRGLKRELSKVCRKVVKNILLNESQAPVKVDADDLETYLGVAKYRFGLAETENQIGLVTGLAWTSVGGELLTIESTLTNGKSKLNYTGKLGEVMQESVQAAFTVIKSRAQKIGIIDGAFENQDLHIHVPEGATPKDGPSAGIAMCIAMASSYTKNPVRADIAMTGEITLRGEVLPIGGLKEKLLAAQRGGIKTVLIPKDNERDLSEISEDIKSGLEIIPVQWIDEVLMHALENPLNTALEGNPEGQSLRAH